MIKFTDVRGKLIKTDTHQQCKIWYLNYFKCSDYVHTMSDFSRMSFSNVLGLRLNVLIAFCKQPQDTGYAELKPNN